MIIRKHKNYESKASKIPKQNKRKADTIVELMEASGDMEKMILQDLKHKRPEKVVNSNHLYSIRVDQAYRIFFTVSSSDYDNEPNNKMNIKNLFLYELNKHDYKGIKLPTFNDNDYQ